MIVEIPKKHKQTVSYKNKTKKKIKVIATTSDIVGGNRLKLKKREKQQIIFFFILWFDFFSLKNPLKTYVIFLWRKKSPRGEMEFHVCKMLLYFLLLDRLRETCLCFVFHEYFSYKNGRGCFENLKKTGYAIKYFSYKTSQHFCIFLRSKFVTNHILSFSHQH